MAAIFNPSSYNLSEIADEANNILEKIDSSNGYIEIQGDELIDLTEALEFVVFQAEKRERRRDRAKNA